MKDKYYTPELEEFHKDFDYETLIGETWESVSFVGPVHFMLESFGARLATKDIRVKYLDQDDIESLGFEKSDILIKSWMLPKEYIGIQLWQGEVILYTKFGMFDREEQVFKGVIKNKSELKRVLKQIGYARV